MNENIQKFASKISTQRHLLVIRDGLASTMPLILIGSIFMMIGNIPIDSYMEWIGGTTFGVLLAKATDSTFGLIAIAAVFSIAYNLAKYYKVDELSAALIALASYIFITPFNSMEEGVFFSTKYFGTPGLFVAILVALITTEIFRFLLEKDIKITMPDSVPPNVAKSFSAFLPGVIIVTIWILVSAILGALGTENIHTLIAQTMGVPLSKLTGNLTGVIVIILTQCFFWLFGVHGAQVTAPIIEPLLIQNSDANRVAFLSGVANKDLPNIITYEFLYNFVFSGGAGAVFALALLVFFTSKSKQNKALGKLSLAPVSFQIAEPILFGLPTILNPKMAIPFVLAPISSAIIVYFAMKYNLVAKPIGMIIPWTTPPVLAGFLATGGKISGAVINIVTIAVNMLIYYPFFRRIDNERLMEEKEAENEY